MPSYTKAVVVMEKSKEVVHSVVYKAQNGAAPLQTIYVMKTAFLSVVPESINVELTWREKRAPSSARKG